MSALLQTNTKLSEWFEEAGHLSAQNVDEDAIPEDQRIPRVTSAIWSVSRSNMVTISTD